MDKSEIIEKMFEKGVLLSKEMLEGDLDPTLIEKLEKEADLLVLNKEYEQVLQKQSSLVDWYEVDKERVELEKANLYESEVKQIKQINEDNKKFKSNDGFEKVVDEEVNESIQLEDTKDEPKPVEIINSFLNKPYKYKVQDFAQIFKSRFNVISKILRQRQEFQTALPISRLIGKKEREKVCAIGLIHEIGITKNGHFMITLEDPTNKIKVLVSKNNKDLFNIAKELVVDEVVGFVGTTGDNIIFAEDIVWPDVPNNNEIKKGPIEEYALFLSDIHVGSNMFLQKEFERFIRWINGETGNVSQRELASKVKYVFIAGDLVDGIGIYPEQDNDLTILDIKEQYKECANLLSKIPKDKHIIICPGNHDVVHLAEPQPVLYKEYASELHSLSNVTLVSNPATIRIGRSEDFEGFNVLLYHGYSFDYYIANIESIRNNGGYHASDLVMKFLLKRRHLAPAFGSTPYFPGHKEDPLLIKQVPDFLLTGHIHYSKVANYKGVTMIAGSCWQGKTAFQEKLGHEPEPARVPVVNLKTREVKILNFN